MSIDFASLPDVINILKALDFERVAIYVDLNGLKFHIYEVNFSDESAYDHKAIAALDDATLSIKSIERVNPVMAWITIEF